jgi:hypothetical protein
MTLIANGILMGADEGSAIPHKLYIHGKIATLNTAADSREARDQQVNLTQSPALQTINNGLRAHYTFDDPSNLGADSSGNGNNGILEGNQIESQSGRVGNAVDFG